MVDELYKGKKTNGFFLEAGASDGETISNSLFFEIHRNWTGLLVEPNPDLYEILSTRNRKVTLARPITYFNLREKSFRDHWTSL